jgi:hypothetical protein
MAAGQNGKPPARDPNKDLFVVFSAAAAARPPALVGDAGLSGDVKAVLSVAGDRKAAGFQIRFKPDQRTAALLLDATSVPKAFSDPDFPAEPEMMAVQCRASKGSTLIVRVCDADDVFESDREVTGEDWNEVKLGLPKDMQGWRPVTRGDGKLARPRSIAVGLRERSAPAGSLDLASVALLPSVMEVGFKTRVPGNLFVTGEKPSGQFFLKKGSADAGARLWIEDGFGTVVRELPPLTLGARETELPLPEEFGYYSIRSRVLGYRSGPAASYAVIPDNRVPGKEPASPFGVCCHWGDYWYKPMAGVVAKRAGIAWIRDGHHEDSTAPGGAYEAAKANGLCVMSITTYCPRSERDVLKPDGTYDFSNFLGRQSAYAKGVGDEIDFYDMTNEPVFQWSKVFGAAPRWVEIFSKHFTPQYAAAQQKADPGSRLLWEGYPDQMEAFLRAGGGPSVFAISPHTYWFKGAPEDRDELNGGYARSIEMMKKSNLSWPVWIGEMGCTTFQGDSQHFKSVTELEQAACLVRACTAHYAAGVEKVFWYDLVEWTAATWNGDPANDAFNCEFHFGIVRKDFTPKPAIAAYANYIAQVKGARWLGRAKVRRGNDVHLYAYQRPGEKAGLVAWTRKGTAPVAVPAGAQVTDLFGKLAVWGGGDLTLTEIPVYISGCAVEVEPVPTYAQMARHFDATTVKLGVRYGAARSPAVARESRAKVEGAASTPAPAARRTVRAAAAAEWDKALFDLTVERIARGRNPGFTIESMGQAARLVAVEGTQFKAEFAGGSSAAIEWKWLNALDRLRLAQALHKDSGDGQDAALVAFFALAAGQEGVARQHLERCAGPRAERVLAGFEPLP